MDSAKSHHPNIKYCIVKYLLHWKQCKMNWQTGDYIQDHFWDNNCICDWTMNQLTAWISAAVILLCLTVCACSSWYLTLLSWFRRGFSTDKGFTVSLTQWLCMGIENQVKLRGGGLYERLWRILPNELETASTTIRDLISSRFLYSTKHFETVNCSCLSCKLFSV